MALFDAYVMVDWSAAATPRQGADSIWVCVYERGTEPRLENPPTRQAAIARLADLLSDLVARGRTTLLGADFNFGYPRGFARMVDERRADWQAVWRRLAAMVKDGPDNANNRFAVAAALNEQLSGCPGPFWGCPADAAGDMLCPTKLPIADKDSSGAGVPPAGGRDARPTNDVAFALPEFRLCEERAKGTQSAWKLYGAGSVGSQTLTGIPHLQALKTHPWLKDYLRVWPFETGLAPLDRPSPGTVILAEVWPSLVDCPPGEVKDAAQVSALCRHFCRLDESGRLGPLFAGDPSLTAEDKATAEREEGWILVVTGAGGAPQGDYIRDPAAIYRRSFAIIHDEVDLGRFPGAMADVAVRVIHACGMPDIAEDLSFSPGAAEAGRAALAAGRPVLVDAQMVAHGIIRRRLTAGNQVLCTLDDPSVPDLARREETTRSAAAVSLWRPWLDGAIVAIGNAPTALFHLLDMIAAGAPRPAVVLGFPVGFVGAAESKEALVASGIPHICLRGRRGGSAMAAAAVNALAGGDA